jgi:hypothetical protein
MSRRKKTSGGQAIVMVTVALIAMCGMMGLAVDLGWSFFVQKQAQAAADGAALAAVQEAVVRLGGGGANVSGFTCASGGTGSGQVDCEPNNPPTRCGSIASTSNLHVGCSYAKTNGFDDSVARQKVTMQSNDGAVADRPPTAPGVVLIAYWVTARTVQTIPQLFSSVLSNTQGTVSAIATAGIVGAIEPGSFFGLNHKGDCWSLPSAPTGVHCGMDLDNGAKGTNGTCPGGGGGTGTICAPAGITLASTCTAVGAGCSQVFAGDAGTHHGVETSFVLLNGTGPAPNGAPGDWHNGSGAPVTPSYVTEAASPGTFRDPTYPNPQPPLQAPGTMAQCGVTGPLSGTLGPYQYFHYPAGAAGKDASGIPKPDGAQLTTSGTVTFSASGSCPGWDSSNPANATNGIRGTVYGGAFPTYVFYGGLSVGGTTTTLGPGQYVMAGVNSGANGTMNVFDQTGGTITGDTATGTMMIFTDGSYPGSGSNPGLATQRAALPNAGLMPTLYQGSLDFKNANMDLSGVENSAVSGSLPTTMNAWSGVVWWQDRRNSMVEYNENTTRSPNPAPSCAVCTKDDGSVVGCADQAAGQCLASQTTQEIVNENHVTANSPGITVEPGNPKLHLRGVLYQPRGGWMVIQDGVGFSTGDLQVITGSFQLTPGTDKLLLQGPSNPLIVYKTALIQ